MRIEVTPPPDASTPDANAPAVAAPALPLVPSGGAGATASETVPDGPTLRERLAGGFHARGVHPSALAGTALMFAGGAAIIFFADHGGMGAILGLVALALGELSLVPATGVALARDARAPLLLPLTDLLMLAGLVAGIAARHLPFVVLLAIVVLVLSAWLPHLRRAAAARGVQTLDPLWGRLERLGLVLVGALMGRLWFALLAVVMVAGIEAWSRVERMESPPGLAPLDRWFEERGVRDARGRVKPAVRWGAVALTVVIVVLLPQSTAWRF